VADVFLSYRNTADRLALVKRLAFILRAYKVEVWWDYALVAGESYRTNITKELSQAQVVTPLWCGESVKSEWVKMEAQLGKDKLIPARLQYCDLPREFEAIQAANLIGWNGAADNPRLLSFVRQICERLGKSAELPADSIEQLLSLPPVPPLPERAPAAPKAEHVGEISCARRCRSTRTISRACARRCTGFGSRVRGRASLAGRTSNCATNGPR
jgi:hypothetical protein